MTKTIRSITHTLVTVAVLWVVDAITLGLTAWILPGMSFEDTAEMPRWLVPISAAFLLSVVNLLIRPLILMLARPLGWIMVFVIGFFVNAIALSITAWLLPGFNLDGLFSAVIAGLVFAAINTILTSILHVNDEGSYYQNAIERQAAKQPFEGAAEPGLGLVMMEIDGLSYHHVKKAIEDGTMPTLQRMIEEEGYVLSQVDCGIPSQTSACQAGIMFGDNYDIPAFRWYDKDQQRLIVSSTDAPELNARYAKGNGLMRGGSSIDNMLNGDAEKSLLTIADIKTSDPVQQKRRAEDIYLLMLNPDFFMRTIVLYIGMVFLELWQGWQQRRHDVQPRLNRLAHFYPFIRAGTSVFVREIAANLTMLDIVRGAPSIYVTWPGYDEVAHHSGPWTEDAFGELKRYDRVIERVRTAVKERAPRAYELIILSDHGQSFGATFKQRYGLSIKEFIEQHLPEGTTVAQSMGGDTGVGSLTAMGAELGNLQSQGVGGTVGKSVAKQGQKVIEKGTAARAEEPAAEPASVTAYGSGNLAQVYFNLYPRKITLSELNAAYPDMVDAVVQHPGIGFVCGYEDDGTPVALGKGGRRNLHTGEVMGEDPLKLYAPEQGYGAASLEKRAWQVRRVMDFPHAGDLMVISTVYADGTVAALEELIGNHGGLGGEQTDAFIFHPPEVEVPDTRNSTDVFHILDARRGAPPVEAEPVPEPEEVSAWAPSNLLAGISEFGKWLALAGRAIMLDRSAYREIAADPVMTGPALLIALVMLALESIFTDNGLNLVDIAVHVALWFVAVFVVYLAGRLLSGKGEFTRTFRALGFAKAVWVLVLIGLIPGLESLAQFLVLVLGFFATWIGAAEAHETRGWRTLVFPLVLLLVFTVGTAVVGMLLEGAMFTIQSLLAAIGL
jgi:uncharacterized membrane protein YvlD (DUF360 family)